MRHSCAGRSHHSPLVKALASGEGMVLYVWCPALRTPSVVYMLSPDIKIKSEPCRQEIQATLPIPDKCPKQYAVDSCFCLCSLFYSLKANFYFLPGDTASRSSAPWYPNG